MMIGTNWRGRRWGITGCFGKPHSKSLITNHLTVSKVFDTRRDVFLFCIDCSESMLCKVVRRPKIRRCTNVPPLQCSRCCRANSEEKDHRWTNWFRWNPTFQQRENSDFGCDDLKNRLKTRKSAVKAPKSNETFNLSPPSVLQRFRKLFIFSTVCGNINNPTLDLNLLLSFPWRHGRPSHPWQMHECQRETFLPVVMGSFVMW